MEVCIMGMGGDTLEKDKRKIADFVNEYVKLNGYDVVMKNKELIELFHNFTFLCIIFF